MIRAPRAWAGLLALTLAAANAHAAPPMPRQPPTLRVAGDTAMAARAPQSRPATGWGEALPMMLRGDVVGYENRAAEGRSTRRYVDEGLWARLMGATRGGDVVFIAFGGDDASKQPQRYVAPEAFRRYLENFVDEARMRGATPVLLTPVATAEFRSGGLNIVYSPHADLVRAVAVERKVPLIDMQRASESLLRDAGSEGAKAMFVEVEPLYSEVYLDRRTRYLMPVTDELSSNACGAARLAQRATQLMRAGGLEAWLEDPQTIQQRIDQVCNAERDAQRAR
ncbi:GDSL-type esterase/lipase family protein [Lysobacter silvisoli]|uniref:SGNH hydrolase-type esterase domain-containing protein n=1 Tax=Lysobacter silvisoli TaxID=2293254 RepID=A0A371K2Y0_9GAMM|nr:GDSL-type esterase/lipase family protein [Lysobacter silvisoli]RDZ28232.1 hypothetical protein DX914_03555 [Lysobacter silvisoli]